MHRDELSIPEPCHAAWSAMEGGSERRFCGSCQKHVHDLSAMSAPEARGLVEARAQGGLCVRYTVRPDGRVRHRSVLAQTARAFALGATLVSLPAAAATAPADARSPLDVLDDLVERALDLASDVADWVTEVAIDVDQLEPCPGPPVELMGDIAVEPDPEPPRLQGEVEAHPPVKLGKIAAPPEIEAVEELRLDLEPSDIQGALIELD